ncbi:MAG: hypothetical protein KJ592_04395, partial [Nanoarchaeota archaeon]|nr:hypothetical protein [Nanoarchaeota archaeon]
ADGTYLWTAYCNDSAGNSDWDAANRTLTIDTTNPTASASCSPASVNIGATTTCSCTGTDATSGVSTTTASSTPSTTTTGTYTYACTATDFAGNSGNTSATYTVTTDNTNTGGSSSSSTTNFWTTTHTISDTEFKESSTKELSKKQRLKVIINSTAHYVGIIELTTTTATVNISSIPQQAILATGDERKFDVNEDNYYDILVKLNSIKNSKANITIQSINEIITQEEIIKETLKEEATTIKNKEQSERKYWIWIIGIIIGIVIISGITYIILKRKSN